MKLLLFTLTICFYANVSYAEIGWWFNKSAPQQHSTGNKHSQSFYAVKQEMLDEIYYDHRKTLYCNAGFSAQKQIHKPVGFKLPDLKNVDFKVYDISTAELQQKAERMEWEHIVPAQNFGKTFTEWSDGHKNCISSKGKKFKGRSCAEKESEEFRYMYTDMYNLYPSIGAVNYLRANFNFTQFDRKVPNTFGSCPLKISKNKAEPADEIKGLIARTYLYMRQTYPRYSIGEPMYSLVKVWDKQYPVTEWECKRAYRIEKVQGNANKIVKAECEKKKFYHD